VIFAVILMIHNGDNDGILTKMTWWPWWSWL